MFKSNFIEDCFKNSLNTIQWSYRLLREYEYDFFFSDWSSFSTKRGRAGFCVSLKSDRIDD